MGIPVLIEWKDNSALKKNHFLSRPVGGLVFVWIFIHDSSASS